MISEIRSIGRTCQKCRRTRTEEFEPSTGGFITGGDIRLDRVSDCARLCNMGIPFAFLVAVALLLPPGLMEQGRPSGDAGDRGFVGLSSSEEVDTPIELEIEDPELFVAEGLLIEPTHQFDDHVALLSRDHFADADLDSSGCRPPPIVS
jgi:hypothetical protein